MHCGRQNRLSEHLQATYKLCISKKKDSPKSFKSPKRFTEVKIDSPNFCLSPTRFGEGVSLLSRRFMSSCHMTHQGGWVRAGAHLCLTIGKPATNHKTETEISQCETFPGSYSSNVYPDFRPRTTYRMVMFIFALEDLGTELKVS